MDRIKQIFLKNKIIRQLKKLWLRAGSHLMAGLQKFAEFCNDPAASNSFGKELFAWLLSAAEAVATGRGWALCPAVLRIFGNFKTTAMTTLTLTLPDDLVQRAETYAHESGRSLEAIVETYLESIVRESAPGLPPHLAQLRGAISLSPQVAKLYGAVELPPDFDYKQTLADALWEKYTSR